MLGVLQQKLAAHWVAVQNSSLPPHAVPLPPGFGSELRRSATQVAWAASMLAHEILHLVWSQEANRPSGSVGSWGNPDDGPMWIPQSFQPYYFPDWQGGPWANNPSPLISGGYAPTRHSAITMYGVFVESLLQNTAVSGHIISRGLRVCARGAEPYYARFCGGA